MHVLGNKLVLKSRIVLKDDLPTQAGKALWDAVIPYIEDAERLREENTSLKAQINSMEQEIRQLNRDLFNRGSL